MIKKNQKLIKILQIKYRLLIGERTAAKALLELKSNETATIYGREMDFAEPKILSVSRMEIERWMNE